MSSSSRHSARSPSAATGTRVVIVTGGSSGLGLVIAKTFADRNDEVVIVGRNEERLRAAVASGPQSAAQRIRYHVADATSPAAMQNVAQDVLEQHGRIDVLVNCVGQSDRGLIENLTSQRVHDLIEQNVISTLVCSQAMLPAIEQSRGSIINIGSLAAKVSPRFLGGYAIAKHALAALTGQMRLELQPRGIHVGLLSPGPIRRVDSGSRYDDRISDDMPAEAKQPGGGTRVKGLDPQVVADAVVTCLVKRKPDVLLPGYLRILIAIGHGFPRLGDWLLLKFTSPKQSQAPPAP